MKDTFFGGNMLFDRDKLDSSGTFEAKIDALDIDFIRYPGGAITERFFDLNDPDKVVDPGAHEGTLTPLSDFIGFSAEKNLQYAFVVPTIDQMHHVNDEGFVDPAYEADLRNFLIKLKAGEYGDNMPSIFEVGNEYYEKNSVDGLAGAVAYAQVAEVAASVIREVFGDDVKIAVQAGFNERENDVIFDRFVGQPDLVDQVIIHSYPWRLDAIADHDADKIALTDRWIAAGVADEVFLSEWNISNQFKDNSGEIIGVDRIERGIAQAAAMIEMAAGYMKAGVQYAAVWPLQQNTAGDLAGDEGETDASAARLSDSNLTVMGEAYRLMSESVVGMRAIETHDVDIDGAVEDARYEKEILLEGFTNDAKTVIFASAWDLQEAQRGSQLSIDIDAMIGKATITRLHVDGDRYFDPNAEAQIEDVVRTGYFRSDELKFAFQDRYEILRIEFVHATGDDSLNGNDRFEGGFDADVIFGGAGYDSIFGHVEDDTLDGGLHADRLDGGAGDDDLRGGSGVDSLLGGEGNDRLDGGAGADTLFGHSGHDELIGGFADDILNGGDGFDRLFGDTQNDVLNGGLRADVLFGGSGDDRLYGDSGVDDLNGGEGDDLLNGGAGDDTLKGDDGSDILVGGFANDELYGGDGFDRLSGDQGDDLILGGARADRLYGAEGDDRLYGGDGVDWLSGGDGADTLDGEAGDDTLNGGAGDDVMEGGHANDDLFGGAGRDALSGGAGDDFLDGGAGDDVLFGGAGDDRLRSSGGDDTLTGGAGADDFFVFAGAGQRNVRIDDFEVGVDHVRFSAPGHYEIIASGDDHTTLVAGDASVTLTGVSASDIRASDYSFAFLEGDAGDAVAHLKTGELDPGQFGNGWNGLTDVDGVLAMTFEGGVVDLTLSFQAFDIDNTTEIALWLNGVDMGPIGFGGNNRLASYDIDIDLADQSEGLNEIKFVQQFQPSWTWGVTNLLLSEASTSPADPYFDHPTHLTPADLATGAYGHRWDGATEIGTEFSVSFSGGEHGSSFVFKAYDIDNSNEIEVLLNGESFMFLDGGVNDGLQDYEFDIAPELLHDDYNVLTFAQRGGDSWKWGVKDIEVSSLSPEMDWM